MNVFALVRREEWSRRTRRIWRGCGCLALLRHELCERSFDAYRNVFRLGWLFAWNVDRLSTPGTINRDSRAGFVDDDFLPALAGERDVHVGFSRAHASANEGVRQATAVDAGSKIKETTTHVGTA